MKRISVSLVQGADGAGKSTLVNAQLARRGPRRVARVSSRSLADVSLEIARFVATSPIDHVIVEVGNGLGEREPGRYAVHAPDSETRAIVLEHTCITTVVDSSRFVRDLVSEVHVFAGGSVHVESHAMMLAEQVEGCEVIVVSKADLVARTDLDLLLAVLSELNPTARVVIAQHGYAPSLDVFDRSHIELAGALRRISQKDVLDPTARERAFAGISSYVYRARRPFHPGRLHAHVHRPWPGVLRSRGIFWLATRMDEAGVWSQAGSTWGTSRGGSWCAAPDQCARPRPPSAELSKRAEWREPWGDRRQELTLIGLDMDTRALKDAFDACLLSSDELAKQRVECLDLFDPFPSWSSPTRESARASQRA
jgi:G3E family GTPase